MQRVTVLYPNGADVKFDFGYYLTKHVPWVAGLVGRSIEVRRGISSPTGSPAFVCIAAIHIESESEWDAVLAKHGAQIMADIPNYTNSSPVLQIDEIVRAE